MQALRPRAVLEVLHRPGRLAQRDAEGVDRARGVEAEDLRAGRDGAEDARHRGDVEAAVVRRLPERGAHTARDLVAGGERLEEPRARRALLLRHRERGGNHRRARMERAEQVRVVEIERVRERAVQQRRVLERVAARLADDSARPGPRRERKHGLPERPARLGLHGGERRDPDKVEQALLQAVLGVSRHPLERERRDELRERESPVGRLHHSVALESGRYTSTTPAAASDAMAASDSPSSRRIGAVCSPSAGGPSAFTDPSAENSGG